jgi:drug/metabolite transporter (DMT)-like permease
MDSRAHSVNPVGLGLASHVLAGLFPFLAATAISRLGLLPATAWIYGIGAVGLAASLALGRWRRAFIDESSTLWQSASRWIILAGLAGFLVAGVAYYAGLARSPVVAEYVFITRLDWILQAPFAILILREPWTRPGLAGGLIALTGGVMLSWTGSIGASGLGFALIYVLASLAGYTAFKPIAAARGAKGAVTLTVWRHWVNTLGFVVLAALQTSGVAPDNGGLLLAVAGAVAILALFLLRFTALTGLPLWVLSVQAPVQAFIAILMTFVMGATLPVSTVIAIGLVVSGECLVALGEARQVARA